jgi:TRAP-type C4-dicarboxylate transport system substrate-binding protein
MSQTPIDPSQYVDEELAQIISALAAEQARRQADKRQALKARIAEMLKEEGITIADLFPERAQRRGRPKDRRQSSGSDGQDFSEGTL